MKLRGLYIIQAYSGIKTNYGTIILCLSLIEYFCTTKVLTLKETRMALEFTDGNFQDEVLNSSTPVLVDFWAVWCGPCRMIAPIVEELSTELDGKVKIGKMNVDENREVPAQFGIRSIPTLLIFKNGEVVDKLVGAVPKNMITSKLEAQMA